MLKGKWINKLWYIHVTEHYSTIFINKQGFNLLKWINLKKIILSEKNCWIIVTDDIKTSLCMIGRYSEVKTLLVNT